MLKLILPPLLLTALAPLASAANVFVDPGFEVSANFATDGPLGLPWRGFAGGGATSALTTTLPRSGVQALTLTINATPNTYAGAFQDTAVIAGTEYTFSGWHTTSSSTLQAGVEARIEWLNGTTEVSRTLNSNPVPVLSTYTPFSLTALAPVGATTARVVYAVQSFSTAPNGNGVVHVDDFSFSAVPEPTSISLLALGALGLARRRR